jgi:hypothetical protein
MAVDGPTVADPDAGFQSRAARSVWDLWPSLGNGFRDFGKSSTESEEADRLCGMTHEFNDLFSDDS